jgi:hypothetical protein
MLSHRHVRSATVFSDRARICYAMSLDVMSCHLAARLQKTVTDLRAEGICPRKSHEQSRTLHHHRHHLPRSETPHGSLRFVMPSNFLFTRSSGELRRRDLLHGIRATAAIPEKNQSAWARWDFQCAEIGEGEIMTIRYRDRSRSMRCDVCGAIGIFALFIEPERAEAFAMQFFAEHKNCSTEKGHAQTEKNPSKNHE